MFPPERIVCLTEETVETLYLLGEERRIVGVSGYAVRPPRVRREKPRVSAFISADFEKIIALKPDLVLTFSDLQADIAAELIRRNIAVHAFNQRDVAGIFAMIRTLGALVGAVEKAEALAVSLEDRLDAVREQAEALPRRPRVYFEEWDEPMISGIQWVSELIEAAGGIEVFPKLAANKSAKDRIVSAGDVIAAAPDIIIGSWCGKKFVPAKVAARPGFDANPGGARRCAARDQVGADPPARPGRADRWPRSVGAHRRRLGGEPGQQRSEIVERLDQRSPAADRVARRQHDAALRRIKRSQRRMAQIVAALVGLARQVVQHDRVRAQHQEPFERHVAAIARRRTGRRLEPRLGEQRSERDFACPPCNRRG